MKGCAWYIQQEVLVFALELLYKVVNKTVIKILTIQVVITDSNLDFEDTLFDRQERDIEGSSSEIEDEDIALTRHLVKTVCDGGCSRLIDDTKDLRPAMVPVSLVA